TVFSPNRVMVRSAKVNSARDSPPVLTEFPSFSLSFTLAGRGAAPDDKRRTSWITSDTCAPPSGAAVPFDSGTIKQANIRNENARFMVGLRLKYAVSTPPVQLLLSPNRQPKR